jgi:exopolysaccharide biosynthesis polyprenyl glycosylphosphotransferase
MPLRIRGSDSRPGVASGSAQMLSSFAPDAIETLSGWSAYEVTLPGRRTTTLEGRPSAGVAKPQHRVLRREGVYRRLLACADVVSAGLALIASITVLGDDRLTLATLLGLPLVVVASKLIGLYDRDELVLRKSTLDEAPDLFQLATLYTLIIWLLEPLLIAGHLGHGQVFGIWSMLFVFSILGRASARAVARHSTSEERCVVIGEVAVAERLRAKLAQSRQLKARVVGALPLEGDESHERMSAEELGSALGELGAERVIIAPAEGDYDRTLDLIRAIKSLGVHVSVLPRIAEIVGAAVKIDEIQGATVLGVRRFGLSRSSHLMKRAFDVAGAAVGLIFALPTCAVCALAIKLGSPGPVLFRQERIGRHGRKFKMLKFRTMEYDAEARKQALLHLNEADGLFKIADDPRVTRVGRFLRRTSLDELPQLWNVLRGEMSLVGPRPLVADDDCRVEGWHRHRLQLTPGMTGHWQVLGSARIPLHEMVEIDYLYIVNWSLWGDVKTLLRTVPHVLARNGV